MLIQKLFTSFILLTWMVPAQAMRFQPIIQPLGGAEKIIIRGFKGKLQIVPTHTETLRVDAEKIRGSAFDRSEVRVERVDSSLQVVVKGASTSEDWDNLRRNEKVAEFSIKVTIPARKLEIFWHEGQVVGQGLDNDLNIQMTKGDVKVTGSKGKLMVQLIDGRIKVSEHSGNIGIQSFKGQTTIDKTKGEISTNNYSARFKVTDHSGPIEFINHSGSVALSDIKGAVTARNVSGVMSLKDFAGSFAGEFQKGALSAKLKELQSFVVNSHEATIELNTPKESGATVSLRSEKGRMRVPVFLGKLRKGRWTERRGRLKGKEQGNIKIISKYGDIVLK